MCKSVCQCASRECNHINGACLFDDSYILFDWDGSSGRNSTSTNNVLMERIKAKHWTQIEGKGPTSMKNCSNNSDTSSPVCDWNKQDMLKLNLSESNNKNTTTITTKAFSSAITKNIDNSTNNIKGHHSIEMEDNRSMVDQTLLNNLIGKIRTSEAATTIADPTQIDNNTLTINTLRSSIVNLTDNIGKLSKQVNDQRMALERTERNERLLTDSNRYNINMTDNSDSVTMTQKVPATIDAADPAHAIVVNNQGTIRIATRPIHQITTQKLENIIAAPPDRLKMQSANIDTEIGGIIAVELPAADIPIMVSNGKYETDSIKNNAIEHNETKNLIHIITGPNNVLAANVFNSTAVSTPNATKIVSKNSTIHNSIKFRTSNIFNTQMHTIRKYLSLCYFVIMIVH